MCTNREPLPHGIMETGAWILLLGRGSGKPSALPGAAGWVIYPEIKLKPELVKQMIAGLSKAVSREGWTCGPAFRPPLFRQTQQDRYTMNERRIYTINKQEIIDGFKYLHGIQTSV